MSTVPSGANAVPQVLLALHAATLHSSLVGAQSAATLHATHAPLPSHTLPPPKVHAAPCAAGGIVSVPPEHVGSMQSFSDEGASTSSTASVSTPLTQRCV